MSFTKSVPRPLPMSWFVYSRLRSCIFLEDGYEIDEGEEENTDRKKEKKKTKKRRKKEKIKRGRRRRTEIRRKRRK